MNKILNIGFLDILINLRFIALLLKNILKISIILKCIKSDFVDQKIKYLGECYCAPKKEHTFESLKQ